MQTEFMERFVQKDSTLISADGRNDASQIKLIIVESVLLSKTTGSGIAKRSGGIDYSNEIEQSI